MNEAESIIELIREAFRENEYPGDAYLQGSHEGCEPFEEVGPFTDRKDWTAIGPDFLDSRSAALSFFSEAAFRYFIPAYLVADLHGQLNSADPVFYLTNGFYELQVEVRKKDRLFVVKSGKSAFINPRRYGAMTFYDYARYRLSVFTREEASAIVAYLEYKRDTDESRVERDRIDAALNLFWRERAEVAPSIEELKQYLIAQEEFIAITDDLRDES